MEKVAYPLIQCSIHPSEIITKIDPTSQAQHRLYCTDCILQANNPKSLSSILLSLDQFLETSAASFSTQGQTTSEPMPKQYAELLSRQDEILSKITQNLNSEKENVEVYFDQIEQTILQAIHAVKQKQLQKLDMEISRACSQFNLFKKQLQRNYPKAEEVESLFPSKNLLKERLAKVANASELLEFVNNLREEMHLNEQINRTFTTEKDGDKRKAYFDNYLKNLTEIENNKPKLEINSSKLPEFQNKLQTSLEEFTQDILSLKNSILSVNFGGLNLDSSILKPSHLKQLRAWLPSKFEFAPRLLYKGSRDGTSSDDFHSKCDNKGPTITIAKFTVPKTGKVSILGGFTDKSWTQKGDYTSSKESFLFSLTANVKCGIKRPEVAIYDHQRILSAFGQGFDFSIETNFVKSQVHPYKSYHDCEKLIEDPSYRGGYYYFNAEEVEVYALQ